MPADPRVDDARLSWTGRMFGGMASSTILTLPVIPAIYAAVKGSRLSGGREADSPFFVTLCARLILLLSILK